MMELMVKRLGFVLFVILFFLIVVDEFEFGFQVGRQKIIDDFLRQIYFC